MQSALPQLATLGLLTGRNTDEALGDFVCTLESRSDDRLVIHLKVLSESQAVGFVRRSHRAG